MREDGHVLIVQPAIEDPIVKVEINGKVVLSEKTDEKIFRNGDFLFGFTGSFRMGQILRYSLDPPEQKQNEDDYKYLCTSFIDAVMECLQEKKFAKDDNGELSGGQFLIGYKGSIYDVQADFQVAKSVEPFNACGCGERYA